MVQIELLQRRVRPLTALGTPQGSAERSAARQSFENREEVFFDGELAKYALFLRQVTHPQPGAPIHRHVCDVNFVKGHAARVGCDLAGRHPKTGGLSGSVWAEQPDDLAGVHIKRDAIHHFPPPVPFYQVARFQQGHPWASLVSKTSLPDSRIPGKRGIDNREPKITAAPGQCQGLQISRCGRGHYLAGRLASFSPISRRNSWAGVRPTSVAACSSSVACQRGNKSDNSTISASGGIRLAPVVRGAL